MHSSHILEYGYIGFLFLQEMAAANPNLLGGGSIGRVEKVPLNGGFADRKLIDELENCNHEKNIFQGLQLFPHNNIVKLLGWEATSSTWSSSPWHAR